MKKEEHKKIKRLLFYFVYECLEGNILLSFSCHYFSVVISQLTITNI